MNSVNWHYYHVRMEISIVWYTTMLTCFHITYKLYKINAIKTKKLCDNNASSMVCSAKNITLIWITQHSTAKAMLKKWPKAAEMPS